MCSLSVVSVVGLLLVCSLSVVSVVGILLVCFLSVVSVAGILLVCVIQHVGLPHPTRRPESSNTSVFQAVRPAITETSASCTVPRQADVYDVIKTQACAWPALLPPPT